jgi:hypothetical protein
VTNGHSAAGHDHEKSDVRVGLLIRWLLYLVIGGVLIYGALTVFWRFLYNDLTYQPAGMFTAPRELPPQPRLQAAPERDLKEMLQRDQSQLQSYGWSDRQKDVLHIPIQRAMDIVIERGLPARSAPAKPAPRKELANEPAAR